ncbi:glycosyltransferase [Pseudomonas sp. 22-AL-CL-001]|uniref:glycosyltransferase n=1 Tax=Pseudomonas alabamensis TaxID=3064349 RepID=UPI00271363E9|nr:glycosyltransferase [Pseudomonas sp. 22-AL-CL-001]MDO7909122.1 glycosyltransferase [Pseudomonas sp. 22-AL-CL-001]
MNQTARVSLVIPAHHPRFFAAALHSALAQTYEALEVVVCDDSEGGAIASIVEGLDVEARARVRYVRHTHGGGLAGNLIHAIEAAEAGLVKVLCDDDRLFPACVADQAQVLLDLPDVSLVLSPRVLCDENDFILPMRITNARIATEDSLFKGEDMLSLLDGRPVNFLGNLSAAMMRREQALQWLRALTADGQQFQALLDIALFACLMRRGDLVMLSTPALVERLHPARFGKRPEIVQRTPQEWRWLLQMVAARSGEAAPASGWVRFVSLSQAQRRPYAWQESCVARILSNWHTRLSGRVGSDCESYAQLYEHWLAARCFSDVQRSLLPRLVAAWPRQPRLLVVVLDAEGDAAALRTTLDSVAAQLYPVQACLVLGQAMPALSASLAVLHEPFTSDWPAQLNRHLAALSDIDWVYLLRAGDRLSESACLLVAEKAAVLPDVACVYGDEGAWVDEAPTEPVFKPDFNLDLLRSYPYVGRMLAFDRAALLALGGLDSRFGELAPHDLLWRLVETQGPQVIEHVAEIQAQSTFSFAQWLSSPAVVEGSAALVGAHLERLGVAHRLQHDSEVAVIQQVEYLHAGTATVSILVVVDEDLEQVQICVEQVFERTMASGYELILVAGAGLSSRVSAWLHAMTTLDAQLLRVVHAPEVRQRTHLIDQAAAQARGDYLLLLDASVQALQGDWLDHLLMQARRPEVAVVGGTLVDARGRVVDGGHVLGIAGSSGPAFVGEDSQARGYLQRLRVVQDWSAVSGDCLMIRKTVFETLGGLSAQPFDSGLAEIDLCLRAGQQGYLVVGTPGAVLLRQASTRALRTVEDHAQALEQQQAFCERWLPKVARDPAYNPSLSLASADFSLEPSLRGSWAPLCARALPAVLGLPVNDSAVGHYRVDQPFRALEAAGRVVGRVVYEPPSIVQLARMDPEVIVFQLRHSEDAVRDIERIARFSRARRIFEIDDYVLQAPAKNTHARNKPADIERHLRRGIALCDRVVVTTQALADRLADMHHDIRVVPNMLAPHLWADLPPSRRATSSKPRVGWGGGTSHGGDLEVIAEVVRALADQVHWVFFGMCPDALKPYIHEYHPGVPLPAYPAKLASLNLDLALAPLEFHVFNDCKSNLRLLEYGACGYPVICTDTEAYRGYLPCTRVHSNSTEEWLQAIGQHLADPAASQRMGEALREAVMRDFVLRGNNLRQWEWGWLAP